MYLIGICREIDFTDIYLIGENGGATVYPATTPPEYTDYLLNNISLFSSFDKITTMMKKEFKSNIYKHPTETNLGFFVNKNLNLDTFIEAFKIAIKNEGIDSKTTMYIHRKDRGIEIVPNGIDKGKAVISLIKNKFSDIKKENIYAFGDGDNDRPMFKVINNNIVMGELRIDNPNAIYINKLEDLHLFLKSTFL